MEITIKAKSSKELEYAIENLMPDLGKLGGGSFEVMLVADKTLEMMFNDNLKDVFNEKDNDCLNALSK